MVQVELQEVSKNVWQKTITDLLATKDSGMLSVDPDTVLADIFNEMETEVSDSGYEILDIWNTTPDESKQYVEATFESLTGVNFYDYVNRCSFVLQEN